MGADVQGVETGPIGAICVSGLPQLHDHQLIVSWVTAMQLTGNRSIRCTSATSLSASNVSMHFKVSTAGY